MFGMGLSNVPRCGPLGDWLLSMQWKRFVTGPGALCKQERIRDKTASLRPNTRKNPASGLR